jgi:hypothetical protein
LPPCPSVPPPPPIEIGIVPEIGYDGTSIMPPAPPPPPALVPPPPPPPITNTRAAFAPEGVLKLVLPTEVYVDILGEYTV